MGSRSSHLRTKVIALLVSLAALWAFAAWVTLRDGLNVLWVQTLDSQVAEPSETLRNELQIERRLSVAYLGRPDAQQLTDLHAQRERSEQMAAAFKESVRDWQTGLAATDELTERIDEAISRLDRLAETRSAVDARSVDRAVTAAAYTEVLDSLFRVYSSLGKLDDEEIAKDTTTLIQLVRVRELMSQEDALLAGVLAAGRITEQEYAAFARLVGAQRFLAAEALAELSDVDRDRYEQVTSGESFTRLRALEDEIVREGRPGSPLPIKAADWRAAITPALDDQESAVLASGDALVDRAAPVAIWVIVRMVLAAGLGLIAVIASVVVSVTTARALVRQLERLREAARQLANERLPGVVDRLGRGEEVDVATEAPPLEFGNDEIGQVSQAFNAVQETAIRTAVEQAELRRSVREIFLSLARRTQALVHRQLTLLDAMEHRETDAEELEDLFRVDHLATRMRRNAENLILLSGSTPGRSWRRNIPMVDVVRGAIAEVEDYTRVNVLPFGPVALAGRAVGDVIHLLAELIENGLSFSPPHTTVEVRGQLMTKGFVIEIEDRGLGMSEEDLAAANERIVDQSELNLANATRLGLYVVSRLTERHGVQVQLRESPYGGTTATVVIPPDLVTDGGASLEQTGDLLAGRPALAGPDDAGPNPTGPGPVVVGSATGRDPLDVEPRPAATGPTIPVALAEAPTLGRSGGSTVETEGVLPTRKRTRPRPAGSGATVPAPANTPLVDTVTASADVATPVETGPAGAASAAGTEPALPVRQRRPFPQGALDGPTIPTGLPLATARVGSEQPPGEAAETGTGSPVEPLTESAVAPPAGTPVVAPPAETMGVPVVAPPAETAGAPATLTGAGLPFRVRQANLAPELRDEVTSAAVADEGEGGETAVRPPDQVRQMMSSYQSGTRRGRADAARLLGPAPSESGPDDGPDAEGERST